MRTMELIKALGTGFALSLLVIFNVEAGCSVHDHNCLHGAYPIDPALGNIPRGAGTLNVTTTYGGAPDVDINQHVALPSGHGPYLPSGGDGNPIEATPLGGGANVIYHAQGTVQYGNGTAGGQLTSAPGVESTTMIGNVVEGTYGVAQYNYDIDELGLDGNYSTIAVAGGTGHFDAPSASHVATPFVQSISLGGGTLGAGEASAASHFNYYDNNFDPHAQGVYLIPDGAWNIGGVELGQLSMFATADGSQGFMLYGDLLINSNPYDLQGVNIHGYENVLYDPNSGLYFRIENEQHCGGVGMDDDRCRNRNQVAGLLTDPSAISTLSYAASVPGEIQEGYGSIGKSHAWDYYHNQYAMARRLVGCPSCSQEELIQMSLRNTADLSPQQQGLLDQYIAKAFAGEKFYAHLKNKKRSGQIRLLASVAAGAAVGVGLAAMEVNAIANSAAAAATGTYYATGDFAVAMKASVTGAAMAAVSALGINPMLDTGAKGIVGGASSEWNGGDFEDGFNLAAIVAGGSNIADYMRSEMIAQSRLDPRNASGNSVGYKGDGFKLGGGRYNPNLIDQEPSPLGGIQGDTGEIFSVPYSSGSLADYVVEAYAGPHDYLNAQAWYDPLTGNIRQGMERGSSLYYPAQAMNWINVGVATPIVGTSVLHQIGAVPALISVGSK